MELLGIVSAVVLFLLLLVGMHYSYYNGVNDGYGYSRDGLNPGYQRAGNYLRKHCAYKWYELRPLEERINDANH